MSRYPIPTPLFDNIEEIKSQKLSITPLFSAAKKDFEHAQSFLIAYSNNAATFNAYRREVERFMQWCWLKAQKSIKTIKRVDIEDYLRFCQKPPKGWIGLKNVTRFVTRFGERHPNKVWRPFVVTLSKADFAKGLRPDKNHYQLAEKSLREIFTILTSFYNYLIQEEYTGSNPIAQIRQKSKYFKKHQAARQIRRLTELQWGFIIETAKILAQQDPDVHERTLFIISVLYGMYLRISELTESDRWQPKMSDFYQDHDGHWWFKVIGKGNKERHIAICPAILDALQRWRNHLNLSPLPSPADKTPLIPKLRGIGGITSTDQIRNIVQTCFDQ